MSQFPNPNIPIYSALTITLPSEVVIKEIPAVQIKASSISINQIIDSPVTKKVTAFTNGPLGAIVLWSGDDYDTIGQWTNADVQNKILQLYSGGTI